jgi:hypothetical protein
MHQLTYINGIITLHDVEYIYEQSEKIDDMCVHIFMSGQVIAFISGDTSINGVAMATADDIINTLNNG